MDEDKKDNTQEQLDKILKITENFYYWEKEKEKLFLDKDKNKNENFIPEQKKPFI